MSSGEPPARSDADFRVVKAPPSLRLAAAKRLVTVPERVRARAARRLLDTAPSVGIDLDLIWVTLDRRDHVGEVAMPVPGAGRTAMLFLSVDDSARGVPRDRVERERAAVANAALEGLEALGDRFHLAQALPEPNDASSIRALEASGMTRVGDLAYLQAPLDADGSSPLLSPSRWDWDEDLRVRTLAESGEDTLAQALEASYEDTLDCPELCGMRQIEDVIASHKSTGQFDPYRWWIVERQGRAEGCVLMSHCPEQSALELVYIGLAPGLRGRGLGCLLLERAIEASRGCGAARVTCAVDRRNTPAMKIYRAMGFVEFTSRVAFVRAIRGAARRRV